MKLSTEAANMLLDTFANISGNQRARARERILTLLTVDAFAEFAVEREALQATIDRQRAADERSLTMLAECRKALADMTMHRDSALATLREQQQTAAAKVPRR